MYLDFGKVWELTTTLGVHTTMIGADGKGSTSAGGVFVPRFETKPNGVGLFRVETGVVRRLLVPVFETGANGVGVGSFRVEGGVRGMLFVPRVETGHTCGLGLVRDRTAADGTAADGTDCTCAEGEFVPPLVVTAADGVCGGEIVSLVVTAADGTVGFG